MQRACDINEILRRSKWDYGINILNGNLNGNLIILRNRAKL